MGDKMDFAGQLEVTIFLDGYIRATALMDGLYGDSNAAVCIVELDRADLLNCLRKLWPQQPEHQYFYKSYAKVSVPVIRNFHIALEQFFLQQPFGVANFSDNKQLMATRYSMVIRIVDYVSMITNDFSYEDILCVDVQSQDGFVGHLYLFELENKFLALKLLKRAVPVVALPAVDKPANTVVNTVP
jgi:hypothetical protein